MSEVNQNPEQKARDNIDKMLHQSGWVVQAKNHIDFNVGLGIAIKEYQTDIGPADYVLFVDRQAVGVIEAKREKEGQNITTVEQQSGNYAKAKLKWVDNDKPLPYIYESTGIITRFTNRRDPKPRSREIFSFHRPETLQEWLSKPQSLRARLQNMPPLDHEGLRDCQITAIENLEQSFKDDRPRALIQMATGAGKTFTAITSVYRLLKHADANRILFLVDTKNLGEQAEQEFQKFVPNDDSRKLVELYNAKRLSSPFVPKDAQVCISTIQRMYSILKGEELDEELEELNPAEQMTRSKDPLPVVYNSKAPPEFFDFIIIDECHRSIYNTWRQVLEYFDASLIGLTATPDNRTYGFFKKNIVSEYDHEKAVADGVNVGNEIYLIETERTTQGGTIKAKQQVEKREKLSRQKRWETQDEDEAYSAKQLDRDIVNPDQIRTVIRTFKENLPEIFPARKEVPKTLIFAKTDSHADDIIQTVREEFGEGNDFCKKITCKTKDEDPKSVLAQFRNDYNPRIAVTVDMIATGTDVKPLECLLFMRDVKSRNYFEQMKGRGTRTLDHDTLKKVTPSASSAKTHYVIVEAIGVTKSLKTASQPLITKPTVPLKNLAMGVMMGASDEDTISSLAGRLSRLNKQLDDKDLKRITQETGGIDLTEIVKGLLHAVDPDNVETKAREIKPEEPEPTEKTKKQAQAELVKNATTMFTGQFVELIDTIRRDKEQTIDHDNLDKLINKGWAGDAKENAKELVQDFENYLEENKDEIEALTIFYDTPQRRQNVTYAMIKDVMEKLRADKPKLAPVRVWRAYAVMDDVKSEQPVSELTALVSLIRRACGIDHKISRHSEQVRKNFQDWIMRRHSGGGEKFNKEQMEWLHMIRDHIINSFHIERDALELSPFDAHGGMGKMYKLFGDEMDSLINELNEALAA
ncbi:MAG: DEAD/DEAH box helicase family protein [Alphaproteobacteria bacterium]|nr:DEAD/DEAH box helicase family protein [Alphaproteobacteria bacterium]